MGFLWGQVVHSKNWGELAHLNDPWVVHHQVCSYMKNNIGMSRLAQHSWIPERGPDLLHHPSRWEWLELWPFVGPDTSGTTPPNMGKLTDMPWVKLIINHNASTRFYCLRGMRKPYRKTKFAGVGLPNEWETHPMFPHSPQREKYHWKLGYGSEWCGKPC